MIRVAVVLLAAHLSFAAPGVKEKGPALYYPVKEGAKLVYEATTEGRTEERTETVTKVEDRGGAFRVTVSRDGKDAESSVLEVSGRGVFRAAGGEGEEPVPLLKLPAKVGDTWISDTTCGERRFPVVFRVGKGEEVHVPAGKFKAIPVEVSGLGDSGCSFPPSTIWYAPGIGVVKRTARGVNPETTVLKSFTPGK